MIAELGLAALWLAAVLALLQLAGGVLGVRDTNHVLAALARPSAILQGILALASFAILLLLFLRTDLSVLLVATNSHSAKPLIFKLSGTWGNHEGSMLLWVTVLAASGALVALLERRLPERTMMATLAAQAAIAAGFYAFLLFSSNPFERIDPPPPEGLGLNPLLQDIGLALHPPTLYFGYVGLSVAFSFAVGALVTRQVTPDFARAMRVWALGAWIFLTLGITAGSYWAYYELGWGGWWFWDPVENASLMPWLAATALIHSASVLASRDALRTWTIMLGVVAFAMSMLGTFLVRSGILTSVHAFAVDPKRGTFILVLLALYVGGALLLFALRAGSITEGERFKAVSREGALVVNNLALSAILGIVLLGTLYPLLAEAMGERVSVGPPYFNPVSAIFFFPMLVVLAVGPLLRWRGDQLSRIQRPLVTIFLAAAVTLVAVVLLADSSILALLGFVLAAAIAVAAFTPLRGRSLKRTPLATWGMAIAHFGVAVSLFGMASESTFTQEKLVAARIGDQLELGPWTIHFDRLEPVAGANWTALEAQMIARRGGRAVGTLAPQARSFWAPQQETSEAALLTVWDGQVYGIVGDEAEGDRWQLRLWWKPFVTFIWYGGILIALGGTLALVGRLVGDRRRRGTDGIPDEMEQA